MFKHHPFILLIRRRTAQTITNEHYHKHSILSFLIIKDSFFYPSRKEKDKKELCLE